MSEQIRQTNNYDNSRYLALMQTNVSVNPFGRNSVSDRAYKKTERLVLATYIVTNHVSKSDDLRRDLRECARYLLKAVAKSEAEGILQSNTTIAPVILQIRTILTLLDLLFASYLASEINVRILKDAYTDLANFLTTSTGSEQSENTSLNGFFDEIAGKDAPAALGHSFNSTETGEVVPKNLSGRQVFLKDNGAMGGATSLLKNKTTNTSLKARAIRTNRRMVILDMLAKFGTVTVKEVAKQIPDCSPKTLQRELMLLESEGTLKKEGNKRWTSYSLVRA